MARISFHGGAGTVTGSRYVLEAGGSSVLIDAGLFQGGRDLRRRNWDRPGFDPTGLDAVVLTHAHIDHSGYLPRLAHHGLKCPVYATPATADLADVMLRDSARIQEEDAKYANKKGYSKHDPALPLYTIEDAEKAIGLIEVVPYGQDQRISDALAFRFVHAGHIIGSGMVEMEVREKDPPLKVLFSGDVGRYDAPLVPDPAPPLECDVLVIESTYGDRAHPKTPVEDQIAEALRTTLEQEGTLVFAAFAVGRSQQLIYLLRSVMERDRRLALPIHLDSPMAIDATMIYRRYPEEHGLGEISLKSGSSVLYGRDVFLHRTREESMRLNDLAGPRVIIASSGMMTGGRILHHLRRLLPDERNVFVLSGFQAPGTRGWRMQRGEDTIRIHGTDVPVRARRTSISGLSAHADGDQLVRWASPLPPPRKTFVTHGDPEAATALAGRLQAELGFTCETPGLGDSFDL